MKSVWRWRKLRRQLYVLQRLDAQCSLEGFETFYVLFLGPWRSQQRYLGAVFSGNVRDSSLFSHRRVCLDEMRHWRPRGCCLKQLVGAVWGGCQCEEQLMGTAISRQNLLQSRCPRYHFLGWAYSVSIWRGLTFPWHLPASANTAWHWRENVDDALQLPPRCLFFIMSREERINNFLPRNMDGCWSSQSTWFY